MNFAATFEQGLTYPDFLARYGTADHQGRWARVHDAVRLTGEQTGLLAGFTRDMKVLVLAGAWCGDCVNQCPVFDHFTSATPRIHLRFFDRDEHPQLAELLPTCGAPRVPAVLFLSEDDQICGRYGDRTLSKYRQMAAQLGGAACPTGLADDALLAAVTQEWLNEFERIQLMLRTSGRLRERHRD